MDSKSKENPLLFPIGVIDFQKIITGNYFYVDKTLGIANLLQQGDITVICRPRRFGKTLFMSMLQNFFAENVRGVKTKTLFENTLLAQKHPEIMEKYQGKYSVIFLSFKDLKRSSYAEAYEAIQGLLGSLYEEHYSLLDSINLTDNEKQYFHRICSKTANYDETINSLKRLTHFLYKAYNKKVIVLMDEYDVPAQEGYLNNYYKEIIKFMRGFFGAAFKDNLCLERGVFTGIARIAKENLFSDLNNVEVHSILRNAFSEYFGFTETEMNALLQKVGLSSQAEEIKRWYNGYQIAGHTVYNPWSIICCLKNLGVLELYWVNTSGNELIKKILSEASPKIKTRLEQLMQRETIVAWIDEHIVFENLSQNETALWSLLLFTGYLTAQNIQLNELGYYQCELRIPNHEVLILYRKQLVSWFEGTLGLQDYYAFINNLLTGKIKPFQEELNLILKNTMSYFDTQGNEPERFYHGLVLGLIATLHDSYRIYSNRESGSGRYDIALIPNKKDQMGVVIEFKTIKNLDEIDKGAEQALQQIKTKLYTTELSHSGIKQVLQLGMAFSGKQVAISYQIDNN